MVSRKLRMNDSEWELDSGKMGFCEPFGVWNFSLLHGKKCLPQFLRENSNLLPTLAFFLGVAHLS